MWWRVVSLWESPLSPLIAGLARLVQGQVQPEDGHTHLGFDLASRRASSLGVMSYMSEMPQPCEDIVTRRVVFQPGHLGPSVSLSVRHYP